MGKLSPLVLVLGLGCSVKAGGDLSNTDTGADISNGVQSDSGGGVDSGLPALAPLVNGTFVIGFSVGVVNGLVVPLQVEIESSEDEFGARTVDSFVIRATDGVDGVSDDLAQVTGLPVDDDGVFIAALPLFTLPAEYSPTGNPVQLDSTMVGTIVSEEFFCGEVSGSIVSFDMDLAGSTFGAGPWADRILGAPTSCENIVQSPVDRMETCPSVVEGRNEDFASGDSPRTFDLILPDGYDSSQTYPLVFAWHGIGGSVDGFVYAVGVADYSAANGFIVVGPQALDRGGTTAWDPVNSVDYNQDIAFFDDMLKCISEQYAVDANRVHSMGMSLGGLMTGALEATRSEVFGSVVSLSGGFMVSLEEDISPIPTLVVWGGADDTYNGQDFNSLADDMIGKLLDRGHFVAGCDHGMGHHVESGFWPFVFQFFVDHPQGVDPEPYLDGLPVVFPDYCAVLAAFDRSGQ
jgi:dienelactone hydrolase